MWQYLAAAAAVVWVRIQWLDKTIDSKFNKLKFEHQCDGDIFLGIAPYRNAQC